MCGVVGLIGSANAAQESFLALTTLQHRGQDAAGILTMDGEGFHTVKNLGLVDSVFSREGLSGLTGHVAIAHTRYSTVGRGDPIDVQPFLLNYPFGLGMVHNGNIVNTDELIHALKTQSRRYPLTHSDTELVLNIFAEALTKATSRDAEDLTFDQICEAVEQVFSRVVGSYSIVTLVAGHGIVAFRDPKGIRPLVWGKRSRSEYNAHATTEAYMVASETSALSFLGFNEAVGDVNPGEVLFLGLDGSVKKRVLTQKAESRPCMFEWIYFASPESVLSQLPVYSSRIGLGSQLAETVKQAMESRGLKPDVIVPVPETSRIAAISLSEALKIPYRELLIKNRYIKRTFILDSHEKRQRAVNLKLAPVKSEIYGKKVLLVDDSIVRGTTSRKLVELVRKAGAKEVYFVSTCPPIRYPCYYGIDFPQETELLANRKEISDIEKELGADAVIYQTLEGLKSSLSGVSNPCLACLTGEYPTDISCGKKFAETRASDRNKNGVHS